MDALTRALLDALEEWDAIDSATDALQKTTVGYSTAGQSKKTFNFMGRHDVRNKLKGSKINKKLFPHIRIADDTPAQPPGGRRGTGNPSQQAAGGAPDASSMMMQ